MLFRSRWIYLGSDGFYWISEYHPDNPNIIEVRKGEAGTRAWPANPGELNYVFTEIIYNYLERNGEKYQHYNDIVGALECCKMELYRRRVMPYEDKKIAENGDVEQR